MAASGRSGSSSSSSSAAGSSSSASVGGSTPAPSRPSEASLGPRAAAAGGGGGLGRPDDTQLAATQCQLADALRARVLADERAERAEKKAEQLRLALGNVARRENKLVTRVGRLEWQLSAIHTHFAWLEKSLAWSCAQADDLQGLLQAARSERDAGDAKIVRLQDALVESWRAGRQAAGATAPSMQQAGDGSSGGGAARAGGAGAGTWCAVAAAAAPRAPPGRDLSPSDLTQLLLGVLAIEAPSPCQAVQVAELEAAVDRRMAPDSWQRMHRPQHGELAAFVGKHPEVFGRTTSGGVYAICSSP